MAFASEYQRAQLNAVIHSATKTEVHALVGAPADTHVQRRIGGVQVEVGIAAGAAVHVGVQGPPHAEIPAAGIHEVHVQHRRRCQLMRPPERELAGPRLADLRRCQLRAVERPVRIDFVLGGDVRDDRLANAEEGAVRVPQTCRVGRGEDHARSALGAQAWEEDGRVGVPVVVVDAPAGSDDIPAVTAKVEHRSDSRLDVVLVLTLLFLELVPTGYAVEAPGSGRRSQDLVVRNLRLINGESGHQVVAQPCVDRQADWTHASRPGNRSRYCFIGRFADAPSF